MIFSRRNFDVGGSVCFCFDHFCHLTFRFWNFEPKFVSCQKNLDVNVIEWGQRSQCWARGFLGGWSKLAACVLRCKGRSRWRSFRRKKFLNLRSARTWIGLFWRSWLQRAASSTVFSCQKSTKMSSMKWWEICSFGLNISHLEIRQNYASTSLLL